MAGASDGLAWSEPEKLCRRGCFHGIRASLERERARVILGWSGRQTARLEIEVLALADCKMMPLVDGRLRKGRTGLRERDVALSLSSFPKLTGCEALTVQRDRFKCQLIELNECKRQQTGSQPSSRVCHRV
jgi:hypothetical protein